MWWLHYLCSCIACQALIQLLQTILIQQCPETLASLQGKDSLVKPNLLSARLDLTVWMMLGPGNVAL